MKNLLRRHSFSIAFLAVFLLFVFFGLDNDPAIEQLSGYTMGTRYHLQVVDLPEQPGREGVAEEISAILRRLDREIFSTYAEDSELSRFNRAAVGEAVSVSAEMIEVVALAREVSEATDGAFDVTVGPLVNLWGFGNTVTAFDAVPPDERIQALLNRVDYRYLEVNPEAGTLRKTADIYVDLSGIAKGYAVDVLADYFESIGVSDYFLEIGGELRISGAKPGGAPWVPAIEKPQDSAPEVYQIFTTRGESVAVAGSGDYRNYFEQDGVRYSHEIDPRTGYPVNHSLAAVYVITDATALADAFATAFMITGMEEGMPLARELGLAVYFITRSGDGFQEHFTPEFRRYLTEDG